MVERVVRALVVVLMTALAVSLAAAAHVPQVTCTPSVEGTVSAINPSNATMILQTDGSGALTVLVRRSSILLVQEADAARTEHPLEFSEIRAGDRVVVHGTCLDERRLLALTLMATQSVSDAATGLDYPVAANGSAALTSTASAPTLTVQTSTMTAPVYTPAGASVVAASTTVTLPSQSTTDVSANQPATGTVEETSTKLGWGAGDNNHTHSGPPGKAGTGTVEKVSAKPGWGYGDKNHTHSGPPGITDIL